MKRKMEIVVVGAIFNKRGKALITKRFEPTDSFAHNKWQLPGGGIEFGEHPLETLKREIKEETGLIVKPLSQNPTIYSRITPKYNLHTLLVSYPCLAVSGTLDISADPETAEAEWVSVKEAKHRDSLPLTYEILKNSERLIKN